VSTLIHASTPIPSTHFPTLARYDEALVQYQTYRGDPIATIDEVLAVTPDFVGGHAFRALVLMTYAERRFAERARISVVAAESLLVRATPRERGLVAAARALVDGDWTAGCAALDRVLVEHPLDLLAIQTAHLFDFLRGDALNLRNRIARVLPQWSSSIPGYSYLLGMYAFGLEECNQYAEAEATARRALEIDPRDAWAVHAAVHVMEMQGRIDDGIEFLSAREADWAPENGLAYHNYWHLALYYLARERHADALAVFDARIHAEPPDPAMQLVDATALLWRLFLRGVDLGDRAARVADNWTPRIATERGFYAFNDAHAMMAFTMAGRQADAEQLTLDLEWTIAHATGTNRMMTLDVGRAVCAAIRAFGDDRPARAIELLEPVRDIATRFGGSHAQRDVLTLTLIEAAYRSGQPSLARHYAAERAAKR
jgi:tetratricopeptide (TPR) repeat protein